MIAVPYHDGLANLDRGRGPTRLLAALDVSGALDALGYPVSIETVDPVDRARPEAARVFELNRRLAGQVRSAIGDGLFPQVLAGDCNSCLGTVNLEGNSFSPADLRRRRRCLRPVRSP